MNRTRLGLATLALFVGCRSNPDDPDNTPIKDAGTVTGDGGTSNNDGGTNNGDGGVVVTDPSICGGSVNVCALKVAGHPAAPAIDGPVELKGVVVTTPTVTVSKNQMGQVFLAGFYVQDSTTSVSLNGQHSGIMVVYNPMQLAGSIRKIGEVIDVSGTLTEFPKDGANKVRQINALRVTPKNKNRPITPAEIADGETIATGGSHAAAYEGSLVKVSEVTVTSNAVKIGESDLFGAYRVGPSLIVWNNFFSDRRPNVGESFASITGVLQRGTAPFNAGQSLLSPRGLGDVLSKTTGSVVAKIQDLQDVQSPGHPAQTCVNKGMTMGTCAQVNFKRVLVTAVGGFVSNGLRNLFVQDTSVVDPKFSGVKIVYGKDQFNAPGAYKPKVGHYVDIEGEAVEYYDGTQVDVRFRGKVARNGTDTSTPTPTVIDMPSLIARRATTANAYEGVLVRLNNVDVLEACYADEEGRDHGQFKVTGDVVIGTAFELTYIGRPPPAGTNCSVDRETGEPPMQCKCGGGLRAGDQRKTGDAFSSITGVIDFSFDDYQVYPRNNADLVLRQ